MKRVISLVLVFVMLLSIPISAVGLTEDTVFGAAANVDACILNEVSEYDTDPKLSRETNERAVASGNLAMAEGCVYSASSEYQGLGASLAFDGTRADSSKRWCVSKRSRTGWLSVTFAEPQECTRVEVFDCGSNASSWCLEYQSSEGTEWKKIKEGTLLNAKTATTIAFEAVTAHSIRLTINGTNSGGDYISLYELEIYRDSNKIIQFDAMDGNCETVSKKIQMGMVAGELPLAIKGGFYFLGWYLDKGVFQERFTESSIVDRDLTVYAKFAKADSSLNLARLGGCKYTSSSNYSDLYLVDKVFDGARTGEKNRWAGKDANDQ